MDLSDEKLTFNLSKSNFFVIWHNALEYARDDIKPYNNNDKTVYKPNRL